MKNSSPNIHSLHPRIGASFALIPITIGIEVLMYFALGLTVDSFGWGWIGMAVLMAATPVVVFYGGSLLIWCPVVQWTPVKARRTVYISVGLGILTVAAGFAGAMIEEGLMAAAVLSVSMIAGGVAIILLNVVWWTPPHLRGEPGAVPCPACGYDLRGQRECRCPECGQEFTLSQLVAALRQNED